MSKTAVIIGGSIAGLMQGIMLLHHGHTVTILEQAPSSSPRRNHAAGIAPGPDFRDFMQTYDRTGRPYSLGKGPAYICDRDGGVARALPMLLDYSSWGLVNCILRANFDGMVSKACPVPPGPVDGAGEALFLAGKIVYGVDFTNHGKVVVKYADVESRISESVTADLIIAADGSFSTVRRLLFPGVQRRYAGYVTWRGTIPERDVEESTSAYFELCAKFFKDLRGGYMIIYKIPSDDGDMSPGNRYINWVWYHEMSESSGELRNVMTDIHGREHLNTIPREFLKPEVWEAQRLSAISSMPPAFAEVLEKTRRPFVTKINDVMSPEAVVRDRLFIVGDALNTLRPHTAQAANQAAFHCSMLEKVVSGELTPKQWGRVVMNQSRITAAMSTAVGMYGLGNRLALIWALMRLLALVMAHKLYYLWNMFVGRSQTSAIKSWQTK